MVKKEVLRSEIDIKEVMKMNGLRSRKKEFCQFLQNLMRCNVNILDYEFKKILSGRGKSVIVSMRFKADVKDKSEQVELKTENGTTMRTFNANVYVEFETSVLLSIEDIFKYENEDNNRSWFENYLLKNASLEGKDPAEYVPYDYDIQSTDDSGLIKFTLYTAYVENTLKEMRNDSLGV